MDCKCKCALTLLIGISRDTPATPTDDIRPYTIAKPHRPTCTSVHTTTRRTSRVTSYGSVSCDCVHCGPGTRSSQLNGVSPPLPPLVLHLLLLRSLQNRVAALSTLPVPGTTTWSHVTASDTSPHGWCATETHSARSTSSAGRGGALSARAMPAHGRASDDGGASQPSAVPIHNSDPCWNGR